MILNVSGRTDIVAFYSNWFLNRYQEGFVDVRNPFYPKQISRIYFKEVDLILFCTKNPIPILDKLEKIKIPMIFHITITPYKKEIEPNVANKKEIIKAIQKLSQIIGNDQIYIRYDPIFLSEEYSIEYHIKAFHKLCTLLNGYVKHIIISFLDEYKNVKKNKSILKYREFTKEDYQQIGFHFSRIAALNGMTIQTCFEENTLEEYGFLKVSCLSHELVFRLTGKANFKSWKARGKGNCHCVEMIDIGEYNTCSHFCKYCYANYNEKIVSQKRKEHNPKSSLLVGKITKEDIIKIRSI